MSAIARQALRLALLLLGAGILVLLVRAAGWEETRGELERLGWGLGLFLLPSLGVHLLEALAWRLSFTERPAVGGLRLLLIRVGGESLNNTLPSAYLGGEPFKAMLLSHAGVSGMDALASVIVAKTALTVGQIASVILGVLLLGLARGGGDQLGAIAIGSLVVVALASWAMWGFYVGQRQGLGMHLLRLSERVGLGRRYLEARREALARLDTALSGFWTRHPGRFWAASGVCLAAWVLEAGEVLLYAWLLDLPIGWVAALAIGLLVSVAKAAGMLIPASLGAQEGGIVLLFLAFGLGQAPALAYSLARRARELVWIAIGFGVLALLGASPRKLLAGGVPPALSPTGGAAEPAP